MKERIQLGKHGLLVLKFHEGAGDEQEDAAQGEDQQLRLALDQHGDDGAAHAQEEAADDDGPVLQQDAGHAFRIPRGPG